jgi:hypothetical protein
MCSLGSAKDWRALVLALAAGGLIACEPPPGSPLILRATRNELFLTILENRALLNYITSENEWQVLDDTDSPGGGIRTGPVFFSSTATVVEIYYLEEFSFGDDLRVRLSSAGQPPLGCGRCLGDVPGTSCSPKPDDAGIRFVLEAKRWTQTASQASHWRCRARVELPGAACGTPVVDDGCDH